MPGHGQGPGSILSSMSTRDGRLVTGQLARDFRLPQPMRFNDALNDTTDVDAATIRRLPTTVDDFPTVSRPWAAAWPCRVQSLKRRSPRPPTHVDVEALGACRLVIPPQRYSNLASYRASQRAPSGQAESD